MATIDVGIVQIGEHRQNDKNCHCPNTSGPNCIWLICSTETVYILYVETFKSIYHILTMMMRHSTCIFLCLVVSPWCPRNEHVWWHFSLVRLDLESYLQDCLPERAVEVADPRSDYFSSTKEPDAHLTETGRGREGERVCVGGVWCRFWKIISTMLTCRQ